MRRLILIPILFLTLNLYAPNDPNYQERVISFVEWYQQYLEEQARIGKLMYAIREVESGNNYEMRGSSTEYGAYQFTRATWRMYSYLYFDRLLPMTKEYQDSVAYLKVKNLVYAGFSDLEIASIWNCGKPDWRGRKGVNRHGVRYDVPNHVRKIERVLAERN